MSNGDKFKESAKDLRYYIDGGLPEKGKKCRDNLETLRQIKLSDNTLNKTVRKTAFRFTLPDVLNDESISEWIEEGRLYSNRKSNKSNKLIRHKNQIKQADKGNEYFANHIKTLSNQLEELKHQTPFSLRMESPNTYNLLRESTAKIEEGLRLLIRVNKEFIPKESE
jgi:hypothetical protein